MDIITKGLGPSAGESFKGSKQSLGSCFITIHYRLCGPQITFLMHPVVFSGPGVPSCRHEWNSFVAIISCCCSNAIAVSTRVGAKCLHMCWTWGVSCSRGLSSPMTSQLMGSLIFSCLFLYQFFWKLIETCRLCVIYVMEYDSWRWNPYSLHTDSQQHHWLSHQAFNKNPNDKVYGMEII